MSAEAPTMTKRRGGGCGRLLLLFGLLGGILLPAGIVGGGSALLGRLPGLIKWSTERAVPGIVLELQQARFLAWNQISADKLVIKDRATGAVLGSLHRGQLTLDPRELWRGEISRIQLENPVIYLTPEFFQALGNHSSGQARETPRPRPWLLRSLQCDFGELYVRGFTEEELAVSLRFAFDWTDFGLGGEWAETETHKLILWAVSASAWPDFRKPFAWLDLVTIGFRPGALLEQRWVDRIHLAGGQLALGPEIQRHFVSERNEEATVGSNTADRVQPWRVGVLEIENVLTTFSDPRPELAAIAFSLNTSFQNIALSALPDDLGREEQSIELADIEIVSPLDPLSRVITLRSVFVRFSMAELIRQRVREVKILSPTVYVGDGLFSYMEAMKSATEGDGEKEDTTGTGWVIDRLDIQYGRLVVGGERIGQVGLPLDFQTSVADIRLDDLASLRMDTSMKVGPQNQEFPALQLSLRRLEGDLLFSYPPQNSPNNVVNTLRLQSVRWRQYDATELWMSATLERGLISARFGGRAYGGYVTAGAVFLFGPDARWLGWVAGTGLDLQALTKVMAPGNLSMSGPADFQLQVDAAGSKIERVIGSMQATGQGRLVIEKLNDLLEALPAEWSSLKRSSTTIALETLRDYDYEKAAAEFWFVHGQGRLKLDLNGPTGRRNFDVILHGPNSAEARWIENTTP